MQNFNLDNLNIGNLINEALNKSWSPASEIIATANEKLAVEKSFERAVGEFIYSKCSVFVKGDKLFIRTQYSVIKIEIMIRAEQIKEYLNENSNIEIKKIIPYIY